MRVKQYNLYKTAKKTAKENNLVLAEKIRKTDRQRLFDFSEIDNDLCLMPEEKESIKRSALKNITVIYKEDFYYINWDQFSYWSGTTKFIAHRVYNEKTGKHLYDILQVVAYNHDRYKRNTVYNDFQRNHYDMSIGYTTPLNDYEI